jgi:hypothetical protein
LHLIFTSRGKKKGSGQPAMNRSKQAGMDKKNIVVLLVGLALASVADAQPPKMKMSRVGASFLFLFLILSGCDCSFSATYVDKI